jgi:hypothetical protein
MNECPLCASDSAGTQDFRGWYISHFCHCGDKILEINELTRRKDLFIDFASCLQQFQPMNAWPHCFWDFGRVKSIIAGRV